MRPRVLIADDHELFRAVALELRPRARAPRRNREAVLNAATFAALPA